MINALPTRKGGSLWFSQTIARFRTRGKRKPQCLKKGWSYYERGRRVIVKGGFVTIIIEGTARKKNG